MRPLDEQLRALIDGAVDPVTADEATGHPASRSRRPSRLRRGLGRNTRLPVVATLAVVLVVVVSTVLVLDDSPDRHRISTPPTGERPVSIIATRGSKLVELWLDGTAPRVVASLPVPGSEGTSLSFSSGGTLITTGANPGRCAGSATDVGSGLTRFDLATGRADNVDLGPGVNGAVDATFSPDATKFAYVEYACQAQDPPTLDSRQPNALVIRDLAGAELRRYTLPLRSPDDGHHLEIIAIAGWEPDGRHLLMQVQHEPTASELWSVDTQDASGVLTGTKLPTPESILAISVTPLGDSGRWAATRSNLGSAEASQIVEYDPKTGAIVRVLFAWSDLPGLVPQIASDPTGQHLLLIVNLNGGPQVLYRWSEGDTQPTKVAEDISAAAWLPVLVDPTQPTTTTTQSESGVGSDPGDGNTQLGPKVVVAQGTHGDLRWELIAYESDAGLCVELRIGAGSTGGCGHGVPPRAVGVSYGGGSGFGGSWLQGEVRTDVARIRVELTNGDVIELVPITSPDFDVNFFVTPLPSDTLSTRLLAFDASGKKIYEDPSPPAPPRG